MPIEKQHITEFSRFGLIAKQVVEGFLTGLHKSPFHGFSVEFAEHKLYTHGDSIKNIDWKLFARTEKLFLKEYEEETNVRSTIVVDVSSSMNFPQSNNTDVNKLNKLGFSVYAAASLLYLLNKQRDASGLVLFDEKVNFVSEIKGSKTHLNFLFSQLELALLNENTTGFKTNITDTLHQIADQSPKRGLVILFTDFSFQSGRDDAESIIEGLQHLKHNGNEVVVFNVNDLKLEVELDYNNRPHKFIDLETREEIKLTPTQVKEQYNQLKKKQVAKIKNRLTSFGIDYSDANINEGFGKILEYYLIKRKKI